jgi:hypothetical protein
MAKAQSAGRRRIPHRILGVDFSGARDAGRRIWIAQGHADPKGLFSLDDLRPAIELPDGMLSPEGAIAALRNHIVAEPDTIAGCDFPFSILRLLIEEPSWVEFVRAFPARFSDPDAFRAWAMRRAGGKELRRPTDIATKTPFNSFNIRIHRQTWWGLVALLHPLIDEGKAVAYPFQSPADERRPVLIEACPACTLKAIGCYPSYKGSSPAHRAARLQILERLRSRDVLAPLPSMFANRMLDDAGGDALDALLAALAAARVDLSAKVTPDERFEGRIYFEIDRRPGQL